MMILALTLAPLAGWSQTGDFLVSGKVDQPRVPAKAYLTYKSEGKNVLDSALISNGLFQFKGTLTGPLSAQLLVDHEGTGLGKINKNSDILTLYIEKGEMKVTATDSIKNAAITGSRINEENSRYKALISPLDQAIAVVKAEYASAPPDKKNDPQYSKDLEASYSKALAEKKAAQYQYINQHPDDYISLMALEEIAGSNMNAGQTDSIYQSLSSGIRNTVSGKTFSELIAATKAAAIGAMAPDFTENDVDDKPVHLSDFRGKYVLVDLWASWCMPCRVENPNLVKTYQDYKDKNFTILSVSLDQPGKKDAWLAAIQKDGLTWTQISDLKFWDNSVAKLYGVRAIPQNFLIDPSGRIVAKNLRGDALRKKLDELLK